MNLMLVVIHHSVLLWVASLEQQQLAMLRQEYGNTPKLPRLIMGNSHMMRIIQH